MNGLEELVQGNSVRWMRRRSKQICEDGGDSQPVLSPEMVMAEFDKQVTTPITIRWTWVLWWVTSLTFISNFQNVSKIIFEGDVLNKLYMALSSSFQSLKVQLGAFDNFGMDSWIGEEELEDKCLDCTSLLSSSLCLGEEEVDEEVSHNIGDRVETNGIQVREGWRFQIGSKRPLTPPSFSENYVAIFL